MYLSILCKNRASHSSKPEYKARLNVPIGLITLLFCIFIPLLSSAEINDSAVISLDCSVPENTQAIRPDPKGTKTKLKVGFFLVDLKEIDDVKQTYTADIFFNLTWNDPRLSKDMLGRSLENCSINLGEIWHPPLIDMNRDIGNLLLEKKVLIDREGNINYKQRYVGKLSSNLNFTDFPFDEQILHFILATYGPDAENIVFELDNNFTGVRKEFSIEGWDIKFLEAVIGNELIQSQGAKSDKNFARIDIRLSADRNSKYYILNIIMPLCLIVLMAWAVFWIDPSAIGPQVGLSTATVFTLIAFRFSLGFRLPNVSYFTRIDNFIMYSTILVFMALGVAIATTKIASDGNEELANRIEKWARSTYLILFLIIIIFTLWF